MTNESDSAAPDGAPTGGPVPAKRSRTVKKSSGAAEKPPAAARPKRRTVKPSESAEPPPVSGAAVAESSVPPRSCRVLVAHPDLATARLASDSLESAHCCQVERTTSALTAYQLALQRDFDLFLFDMMLPVLHGPLLFDLLDAAYRFSRGLRRLPQVLYFCGAAEMGRHEELLRDVRVRGLLAVPLDASRLLAKVRGVLPLRSEPMQSIPE